MPPRRGAPFDVTRARGNKPRQGAANQGIVNLSCVTDRNRGKSSWLPDDWTKCTNIQESERLSQVILCISSIWSFFIKAWQRVQSADSERATEPLPTVSHRQRRRLKKLAQRDIEIFVVMLTSFKAEKQTRYLIQCFVVWVCVIFSHTWHDSARRYEHIRILCS